MVTALYHRHATTRVLISPALVVALRGTSDHGYAQTGAVASLLRGTDAEEVASFDVDELLDYRTQPPMLTLVDGLAREVSWPGIRLDAGCDAHRQDWLLLHGPAPAYRWQAFGGALAELAARLGVRVAVALGAAPAPLPHTRPVRVLGASARPDLLDKVESRNVNTMTIAAGIDAALADALEAADIPGVTLWAQVPSYLAGSPYPAATAALLDTMSVITGLSVDTGKLHATAADTRRHLDDYMRANARYAEHVHALERHFDAAEGPHAGLRVPTDEEIARELRELLGDHHSKESGQ